MLKYRFFILMLLIIVGSVLYSQPVQAQPSFGPPIRFDRLQFSQINQTQINFPTPVLQSQNTPQVQFENLRFPNFATPIVQQSGRNARAANGRPFRQAATRPQRTLGQTPELLQVSRAARIQYSTANSSLRRERRDTLNSARAQVARAELGGGENRARRIALQAGNSRRN